MADRVLVPALVLAALAALGALALAMVRIVNARRARRRARYVEILASPEADLDGAAQLWSALHDALRPRWHTRLTGRAHVAFELAWSHGGALRLGVWVAGTVAPGVVERAIEGAWPGTATRTTADLPAPLPLEHLAIGGELRLGLAEWFALKHNHRNDPLRAVIAAGGDLRDQETACVQVLARPVGARRLRRADRAVRELRAGKRRGLLRGLLLGLLDLVADPLGPTSTRTRSTGAATRQDPTVSRDVTAILAKLTTRPCWELRVRYGVAVPAPEGSARPRWMAWRTTRKRLRGRAHTLASAFGVYTDRNHLARHRLHWPATVLAARRLGRGDLVCLSELVALAHLPTDTSVPGLARAGAKAVAPLPEIPTSGKLLGDSEAGARRPVALAVADARYHLHLMGKTGSGKSSLICNLVLGDLAAGRGAVVIDPKGDLIRDLLERLPEHAARRLVLLDPDERHAPPALNVLDGPDPELAVDHLVGIFRNVFAAVWGPRTDDTLRAACLTLLSVPQAQATLADVPRLLMEPAFRQRFTTALHPRSPLGVFWTAYERTSSHAQAVMVGPVLARLRAFLMRSFVADVVGSVTSSFDMAKVLDGGLLLARLPKGQLGAETSRLLGSLIVAKVWQTALARAQLGEQTRTDATLAVDECHNYLTLPVGFEEMFAEARGYRLSLVLAHQHLAQLPRELREAISANARNKLWFTMSPEDANQLERHVAPDLTAHDLAHLGAWQAACRLVVDGRELPGFTLRTRPTPPPVPGRAEQLRAAARHGTGRPPAVRREQHVGREARTADAPGRRGFRAAELRHGHTPGRPPVPGPDRAARLHRQDTPVQETSLDHWEEEDW